MPSTPKVQQASPLPRSLSEAPRVREGAERSRQGSEECLCSTCEKVLDELHPQGEWYRQMPQEAGRDTERMRV